MIIESIPIKSLKLLEKNPRRITKEQMQKLCKSITDDPEFLFSRPVLVNRVANVLTVYAGNQRVRAAKALKMKEIPCIIEDDLDEELIAKRVVLDNKTFGEFDFDLLANEYNQEMLLECGFTEKELLGIHPEEEDQNDDEEPKKKKKTCPNCGATV